MQSSSFEFLGIFLPPYLHSYKNKGLEQRHRIVTTIEWSLYILSLCLESIIVPELATINLNGISKIT